MCILGPFSVQMTGNLAQIGLSKKGNLLTHITKLQDRFIYVGVKGDWNWGLFTVRILFFF